MYLTAMLRIYIFVDIIVFSLLFSVYATERVDEYKQDNENDSRDQFLELSNRMQMLELRDKEKQEEINILKARGNEQLAEINILKARGNEQLAEINILKAHGNEQQAEINILKARGNKHQAEINIIKARGNEQQTESSATDVQSLDSAEEPIYDNAESSQRIRRQGNEVHVAFFATLSHHLLHTGVGQNIAFDHVITNDGSAYSNTLGAFVAPVDGTYVFSTGIMSYNTQQEHYWLAKNGQDIRRMYVKADSAPYASVGTTAILNLKTGDNIEIKTADGDGSAYGGHYSSFSGFLLYQASDVAVVGK